MQTDDENDPVPAGQGTIELTRVPDGYRDFLRSYTVLVDEVPAGRIRRGQTLNLQVPAGTHQLRLTIAWCSSPAMTVDIDAGTPAYFACAPGDQPSAITAVTSGANDYISLWRTAEAAALPARTRIGRRRDRGAGSETG
ncbi:hypothetical protein [Streptomyces sp. NBC_01465]|uniref:hypothetical protein n=1 Tax=Streptomyces sp. NBC_01465 TaxID=2903878 RepID=UPI002E33061E|nr:hypothetical protein [Streptomyces sp. NBC_01465]